MPGSGPSNASDIMNAGYSSYVAIPAIGTSLPTPTRAVMIKSAGNLGVIFPDGTSNNADLIAVPASAIGTILELAIVAQSAANTVAMIGLR